ncbi:MAG: adenosylmethionine--8-amino-7-oxononanoate transaminase [Myxococcales bacterium]|nr:adenosylmethionine--8-amino-7-oxononanoate transaminase [Myxococcales bacterium]
MSLPKPSAAALLAGDASCVWHPYTRHGIDTEPLAVVAADGAILHLADGRRLIDGISSWWASVHGHGHPALIAALQKQARILDHVLFAGATHPPAVELAQRLVGLAPSGLSRVFFSDDGSTAVEVALKMAYHAWLLRGQPHRKVFVALTNAYHGDTFGAMSVGDPMPYFDAYGPLLFEVHRVAPEAGALAGVLEALGDRVAALIVEPLLQAAGGFHIHPPAFLQAARALCDQAGIFLIADEVATGFGRTGAMFACDKAGLRPDFLCVAKALTNGMASLAATLTTEQMFRAFAQVEPLRFFPHGHTMTANPIACAVASASLQLMADDDVVGRLEHIGHRIYEAVSSLAAEAHVEDVRRIGGVVAIELAPEPSGQGAARALRLRRAAEAQGVLLRPMGDVLYAWPPACTTDEQVEIIARGLASQVAAAKP